MSSWRHIRWSLCRGDKLVIRIFEFEFVLYDSSPQLTNTGFLIGDIVVRVREDSYGVPFILSYLSYDSSQNFIARILRAHLHPPNYHLYFTGVPQPFRHRHPHNKICDESAFQVDEKEGVSSWLWREERDADRAGRRAGWAGWAGKAGLPVDSLTVFAFVRQFVVSIIASRSGVTWDDVDVEFAVFTSFALEFH
ncbi:hypothetical protein C8J56DRAFT_1173821 [Mycena floridula]|nr:hypothetical protein C8J56DRAFT_1173821 [Mycena floridula]